jgi:hypothetical protein
MRCLAFGGSRWQGAFRWAISRSRIWSTKTTGFLSGVVCAGAVLFLCAGPLARLVPVVVPSASRMGRLQLLECLIAFALPELAFVAAAVALWRKRRTVATGILIAGVTLIAHLIIHFSTYGWLS